jgi:hypothetical protein
MIFNKGYSLVGSLSLIIPRQKIPIIRGVVATYLVVDGAPGAIVYVSLRERWFNYESEIIELTSIYSTIVRKRLLI